MDKMTIKDAIAVINSSLKWHKENIDTGKNLSKEYKKGFMQGLKQAKLTILSAQKSIKEEANGY